MPIISCPYCGAERNTPAEKLPPKPSKARCPECRRQFVFEPAQQTRKIDNESTQLTVICPHCGLQRTIATERMANKGQAISCRRCRHSFSASGDPSNQPTKPQLRPISNLFADSWELFCRRGWGLLVIYLAGWITTVVPLLTANYLLKQQFQLHSLNSPALWLGFGYAIFCSVWMSGAMLIYLCNPNLGLFASATSGLRKLWAFATLILLTLLLLGGASLLLVVPGVIFCGWFFFAQFVLAEENIGGLRALAKSRQLVRGNWWALCSRLLLLFLFALAVSALSARLPLIGVPVHFAFSLVLAPFSLIYCYLTYLDLKRGYLGPAQPNQPGQWLPLAVAALGWLLVPALLFLGAPLMLLRDGEPSIALSDEVTHLPSDEQQPLTAASPEAPFLPQPQALTLEDYDRLLSSGPTPLPHQGIKLGPLTLTSEQFWGDSTEPHLWLKLQLNDFPNLLISRHRSARVVIDQVLDPSAHDHYDRNHSFEQPAFEWINFSEQLAGIRNVYLQQGTKAEQISSILGHLEINLPLDIKQLQLKRSDIGKPLLIAGKQLTVNQFNGNRVSLSFQGRRKELLSIRAVNRANEPLTNAGSTWQQQGESISCNQMFSGPVEQVTILVASDAVTRIYPFEITR